MIFGTTTAMLVASMACLALALRGLHLHRLGQKQWMLMAAAWLVIIIALTLIFRAFAPAGGL